MFNLLAEWAALASFTITALMVAAIDSVQFRIPDRILLPGSALTLTLLTLAASSPGNHTAWNRAILCSVFSLTTYLLLHLTNRDNLGFGDVKLAGLIGLVTGWFGAGFTVLATVAAFLAAGFAVVVLILRGKMRLHSRFAFAPWMALGAVAAIVSGLVAGSR
ncbi:MAG: prepilin peptidase [Promicromonosporaceae bacterium]|nr:prepilin peptidase [Promicromonosporaceae bacterium]